MNSEISFGMELSDSDSKRTEESQNINWDKAFHLFTNIVTSGNTAKKIQAVIKLGKMSRYAPESFLELTVPILVQLLGSLNLSVYEASAYALKCISSQKEGKLAVLIGKYGAIPILLRLLPISERGLLGLFKCLRNIITFGIPNRAIVAANGGNEMVLNMLNSCADDSKLVLLEILSVLALTKEMRKLLWSSNSVHHLIEAARYGSQISRTRAAHAIGLLGLVKKARPMLVNAGAINALADLLKTQEFSMNFVAGNALGIMADHVNHIRLIAQEGIISIYVALLEGSDPMGKEIAEDVLCILAFLEDNAIIIVQQLVTILQHSDNSTKTAAADILWNLSSYEYSQPVLQNSGVIQILVGLLTDDDPEVKEKVTGAVAQLCYNEADRAILADLGAIPILVNMLENESDDLRDNAAEALVNFSRDTLLVDQMSVILESPSFQLMRDRIMRFRIADEHMDLTSRQMSREELDLDTS